MTAETGDRLGLLPSANRYHMTDEAYQLFLGLESAGYRLVGHGMPDPETDVVKILNKYRPHTVVVQDKREWTGVTADRNRDPAMCFRNVGALRARPDIFKVTVVKDAHSDAALHRGAAADMGVHAWIVYYHPDTVARLAPYVRRDHLVRTYHTVDPDLVPCAAGGASRSGALISGALSGAYPLRSRLAAAARAGQVPGAQVLPHPGYHRRGPATPEYLRTLSGYRVAVCTSSVWGFALRKIMEATACGCAVVTDLPEWDVLPEIDANLHRISASAPLPDVVDLIGRLCRDYDADLQADMARRACRFYGYRAAGARLAADIEALRARYRG